MKRKNPDSGDSDDSGDSGNKDAELESEIALFFETSSVEYSSTFLSLIEDSEKREKVLNMAMEIRKSLRAKEERSQKKLAIYTEDDFENSSIVDWAIHECRRRCAPVKS